MDYSTLTIKDAFSRIDSNNSNSKQQTYKLTFAVKNYMVELNNIELIPDNDPQLRDLKNE